MAATRAGVVGVIIAVRRLRHVDVPAIRGVARALHAHQFLERGRDDGAAGARVGEEGLLVHFLGAVGVADEHDFDALVAPFQEHVQQQEEPLGEVLHLLGHRAGHVHKAEHHRARRRLGVWREAAIAEIHGIDPGHQRQPPPHRRGFVAQQQQPFGILAAGLQRGDFRLQFLEPRRLRPLQPDAPRHRPPHGARQIQRRRRAVHGKPAAHRRRHVGIDDLAFHQVGQFQVLEEQFQEFVARQHEPECVLAAAAPGALAGAAALAAATGRPRQLVAGREPGVAGQHDRARAVGEHGVERRLVQHVGGNFHRLVLADRADAAALHRVACGLLQHGAGALQQAPPVRHALAAGVGSAIDDVHGFLLAQINSISSPAYTIPRVAAPAVRCSRVKPCG